MLVTLRIAWRNLGRNRRRSAMLVVAIAVAQTAVLGMSGLMNGFVARTLDALTGPMTGHAQIHHPLWRKERAPDLTIDELQHRLRIARQVEGVADAYARIYAPVLIARDVAGYSALALGVDVDREANAGGLLEGIEPRLRPRGREVLIGASLARTKKIAVGDSIALIGAAADGSQAHDLLVVKGLIRSPMDRLNRSGVVMPLETAQEIFALHDRAHEITLRGARSVDVAPEMAARVARADAFSGLEVLPWRKLSPEAARMTEVAGSYATITLVVLFLCAAVGVMNAMLMATFERRRELGMLLSLGTTPRRLVLMVLAEAVLLGLAGIALGSLLGVALVTVLGHVGVNMIPGGGGSDTQDTAMFGMSYAADIHPYVSVADALPGLVGIALVCTLAALWPALRTARLQPVEALR